jgi:hypothetical protein
MPAIKKTTKKNSAPKKIKSTVKKILKSSINKIKSPVAKKTEAKKKSIAPVKRALDSSRKGITVQQVVMEAEVLHLIPVQSEVHPITIEENKKLEPQFHQREDVVMQRENYKANEALATRKGTRNIYRRTSRRS